VSDRGPGSSCPVVTVRQAPLVPPGQTRTDPGRVLSPLPRRCLIDSGCGSSTATRRKLGFGAANDPFGRQAAHSGIHLSQAVPLSEWAGWRGQNSVTSLARSLAAGCWVRLVPAPWVRTLWRPNWCEKCRWLGQLTHEAMKRLVLRIATCRPCDGDAYLVPSATRPPTSRWARYLSSSCQ
jgi:hypothetical protein